MNLNSLGIPPLDQSRVPSIDFMPLALNQNNKKYWPIAIGKVKDKNPRVAWTRTIDEFVKLCDRNNTYPFTNEESNNDQIIVDLISARRSVVRFIDKNKILDEMIPYRINRTVRMTNTGFSITIDIHAQEIDHEPGILSMLGNRKPDGKYSIGLQDNIVFFVYNEGASLDQRWHFGYEIQLNKFPSVPGKRLPSKSEQEKFVLEVMYMPLMRCYRPIKHQKLI